MTIDALVGRVRRAGATGEVTFRADSGFWSAAVLAQLRAHDVRFSITVRQTKPVRRAITAIGEGAWADICYPDSGVAQVAETRLRGNRRIVRRVRHRTDQGQLFATRDHHAFVTDQPGSPVELDADHRRHAMVELAIRDAKQGSGLNHHPSGSFFANAAWLVLVCAWPTTCCAGPPPSALASAASRSSPRPCGAPCWPCPAGSPARPGGGRCTCPPAGRGRTRSPWPWRGCAAFRPRRLTPPEDPSLTRPPPAGRQPARTRRSTRRSSPRHINRDTHRRRTITAAPLLRPPTQEGAPTRGHQSPIG
ncbi:MAG TPA: transposase [Actinomycetota bacterium]|nr:transposase [Actinomycetota bacterium]